MRRLASSILGRLRPLHRWIGVALCVFFLVIAPTGILLNHKEWLPGAPAKPAMAERKSGEPAGADSKPARAKAKLTTALDAAGLLPLEEALEIAREKLGDDAPLDSISLGASPGGTAWIFRSPRGADPGFELAVNAKTGETSLKKTSGYTTTEGDGKTSFAWNRLAMDLHTGKFWNRTLGPWLFSDLAAVGLLLLTASGFFMWALPAWRKRKSKPGARAGAAN